MQPVLQGGTWSCPEMRMLRQATCKGYGEDHDDEERLYSEGREGGREVYLGGAGGGLLTRRVRQQLSQTPSRASRKIALRNDESEGSGSWGLRFLGLARQRVDLPPQILDPTLLLLLPVACAPRAGPSGARSQSVVSPYHVSHVDPLGAAGSDCSCACPTPGFSQSSGLTAPFLRGECSCAR